MSRRFPKIRLRDLDWKMTILLSVLLLVTWGDDFLLPVIGEMIDPIELVIDALVAYTVGKRAARRAIEREGTTVEGKVAYDPTADTVVDATQPKGRK